MHGVFVIATTSRPDLVDPALLRAGRLDLAVLCPIPSPAERADILARLARGVSAMTAEASRLLPLLGVCEESDGCTGADLQGLITSANLVATREILESSTLSVTRARLAIEARHVEVATRSLRPSLSRRDRAHYDTIYEAFSRPNWQGAVSSASRNAKTQVLGHMQEVGYRQAQA